MSMEEHFLDALDDDEEWGGRQLHLGERDDTKDSSARTGRGLMSFWVAAAEEMRQRYCPDTTASFSPGRLIAKQENFYRGRKIEFAAAENLGNFSFDNRLKS